MNRDYAIDTLLGLLRERLALAENASRDAADYATNEESRAESEWDTQGIEASYLAAGQAAHARDLMAAIDQVQGLRVLPVEHASRVVAGSLVECVLDGGSEWFLFAPAAGGEVFEVDGVEVTVVTPQSPLGDNILGLCAGDSFEMANGMRCRVNRVE